MSVSTMYSNGNGQDCEDSIAHHLFDLNCAITVSLIRCIIAITLTRKRTQQTTQHQTLMVVVRQNFSYYVKSFFSNPPLCQTQLPLQAAVT
mmetsp:Transcript_29368/g.61922  ORF Transcript_29368/g.61922 Transcript_29368/m.61922 type:complete len:91 (+) Transcript_29368:1525-1797(+)